MWLDGVDQLCCVDTGESLPLGYPPGHRDGGGDGVFGSQGSGRRQFVDVQKSGEKDSRQSAERGVVGLPPFKIIPSPWVYVASHLQHGRTPAQLCGIGRSGGVGWTTPCTGQRNPATFGRWSSGTFDGGRLLRRQDLSTAHCCYGIGGLERRLSVKGRSGSLGSLGLVLLVLLLAHADHYQFSVGIERLIFPGEEFIPICWGAVEPQTAFVPDRRAGYGDRHLWFRRFVNGQLHDERARTRAVSVSASCFGRV